MKVINLQNPRALLVPDVQGLIERSLEKVPHFAPGGASSVAEDLLYIVQDPGSFLLLGAEDGAFKGLVIGNLPQTNFFPYPVISVVYNEGSTALLKEMQKQTLDIIVEAGYTKAWAANVSGHSDAAWLRAFKFPGVTAKQIGTLHFFEVK